MPIAWDQVPNSSIVEWDSIHSAVCVSWNPPTDEKQQLLLSILGLAVYQNQTDKGLLKNKSIVEKCEMVMTSNNMWKVGDLPFYVYAMAKPDESLDDIETLLDESFHAAVQESLKRAPGMAGMLAAQFEFQSKPANWMRIQQTAKFLEKRNRDKVKSLQQTILHDALTRGLSRQLLGSNGAEMAKFLKTVKQTDFEEALNACMTEENRKAVHIIPMNK